MLPQKRANTKPIPAIPILASNNAIKAMLPNNNRITLGLAKLAEPDILSKGFIWLLFVVNLICFIKCDKAILSYFIKKSFIKFNSTRKDFLIRQG